MKGKEKGKMEREEEIEQKREKKTKRVFRFSLRSTEIGLSVFIGARSKFHPRNEGYTWVPKSRSFIKLQEVGNFPRIFLT